MLRRAAAGPCRGGAHPGAYYAVRMATADEVRQRIESGIPGARAEVRSSDDVHFSAHVVSNAFSGMNRVQQHRLVYDLFAPGELGGAIHALSLKTETP